MEQFLYQALQAVIIAAIPVLVPVIVKYVLAKVEEIKGKLSQAQLEAIRQTVYIFVTAAEQMYTPDQWKEKKEYVIEQVQNWLDARGIELDFAEIEALIEYQVNNLPPSNPLKAPQIS